MSEDARYRMARGGAVYLFSIGAADYAMEFLRDYFAGLGATEEEMKVLVKEHPAGDAEPPVHTRADEVASAPRGGNTEIDERTIERIIALSFPDLRAERERFLATLEREN